MLPGKAAHRLNRLPPPLLSNRLLGELLLHQIAQTGFENKSARPELRRQFIRDVDQNLHE
jgi:hypothetical protein